MNIKKLNKILIMIAIFICILLLSETKVNAMTSAEAGKYIANYAINFYEKCGTNTVYTCVNQRSDWQWCRGQAYELKTVDGAFRMDCAGFVNLVIHNATGLELSDYGLNPREHGLVAQNDCWNPPMEQISMGDLQPGDIVSNSHHVGIYVGNNMVVHCDGGYCAPNGRRNFV